MRFICRWLKICVAELRQKMNYQICLIIYWTLHVMKKILGLKGYNVIAGGVMGKIIKDTIHANGIDIGIYT